ncbi:MAG: hypothetical protein COA54_02460 [Thiotrichaceae bacterium]|nr:MAG: hypothetical protein COA54_02460 [Thiotrichaceae bacterium]
MLVNTWSLVNTWQVTATQINVTNRALTLVTYPVTVFQGIEFVNNFFGNTFFKSQFFEPTFWVDKNATVNINVTAKVLTLITYAARINTGVKAVTLTLMTHKAAISTGLNMGMALAVKILLRRF